MLHEAALAALCGRPAALDDAALGAASRADRAMAVWLWCRLYRGGAARHPELVAAARDLAARDALALARLRRVIDAFAAGGVPVVILKGVALAHGYYPAPWARARLDDDLLVRPRDFTRASALLASLGYEARLQNPGPAEIGQGHFTRISAGGDAHHIDLHMRPFVPGAFAGVADVEGLMARARPLVALGTHALAPAPADTLLLGIAHRVAHHAEADDPVWQIDAHLVARTLDEGGWREFRNRAVDAGLARVAAFELGRAQAALGTPVPAGVLAELARVGGEASAAYLDARGRLARLWLELHDAPGGAWRPFRSRAFPDPAYMRARYGVPPILLPVAYLWRGTGGGARWLLEWLGWRYAARRR
jgi:hypothetical protein